MELTTNARAVATAKLPAIVQKELVDVSEGLSRPMMARAAARVNCAPCKRWTARRRCIFSDFTGVASLATSLLIRGVTR